MNTKTILTIASGLMITNISYGSASNSPKSHVTEKVAEPVKSQASEGAQKHTPEKPVEKVVSPKMSANQLMIERLSMAHDLECNCIGCPWYCRNPYNK